MCCVVDVRDIVIAVDIADDGVVGIAVECDCGGVGVDDAGDGGESVACGCG